MHRKTPHTYDLAAYIGLNAGLAALIVAVIWLM